MIELRQSLSYGGLAFVLGFIGLPLYVYLPKYYSESFHISLVALSFILFLTRLIDTLQDPLIGWLSDRLCQKGIDRRLIIKITIPLLCLTFLGLLFPPSYLSRISWITGLLIMTYTLYSFVSVNYYTIAAEITEHYNQQTKLVSARESFALLGIATGSIIPSALLTFTSVERTHFFTWLIYISFAAIFLTIFLKKSPKPRSQKLQHESTLEAILHVKKNKKLMTLILIYFLSTVAAALPATIVLFYIKDVLNAEEYFGLFLLIYFISALLGIPIWYKLSSLYSKSRSWMIAMCFTILGFIWATFLQPESYISYGIICVATGLCLGADLVMPFSILSDLIIKSANKAKYFGVWGMVGKSSIAIAGSLGLLVLGLLGYNPGMNVSSEDRIYISISYALIPCLIKFASFVILYKSDLDKKREQC